MTLDEAIKELEEPDWLTPHYHTPNYDEAIQLALEALKRIKECGVPARCGLLERPPGETPE